MRCGAGGLVQRLLPSGTMTSISLDGAAPPGPACDHEFWRRFFADQELFFRMCVRWLRGNHHDAEDAISRGALRALDYHRRRPEKVVKFRPWMLRLLYNLCADMREAQDRYAELPSDDDEAGLAFASATLGPERVVYAHELREVLSSAVADLPRWLHAVFRMRLVDESDYTDICQAFEISPENARQRVQQARRHLRSRLGAYT